MSAIDSSPFCAIDGSRTLAEDELAVTYLDGFSDSPGHALIPPRRHPRPAAISPRRHFATLFKVTEVEQTALLQALNRAKAILVESHHPDGYSIGINHGEAAGQTMAHPHIYRYSVDSGDDSTPAAENLVDRKSLPKRPTMAHRHRSTASLRWSFRSHRNAKSGVTFDVLP